MRGVEAGGPQQKEREKIKRGSKTNRTAKEKQLGVIFTDLKSLAQPLTLEMIHAMLQECVRQQDPS